MQKNIRKSVLCVLLALIMCLTLFIYAGADSEDRDDGGGGMIESTYIDDLSASLNINSTTDTAYVSSRLQCFSGVDESRISVNLQKYVNGNWQHVYNWSKTEEGTFVSLAESRSIDSGYYYRIKTYGYAIINGQVVESTIYYSNTRYCF